MDLECNRSRAPYVRPVNFTQAAGTTSVPGPSQPITRHRRTDQTRRPARRAPAASADWTSNCSAGATPLRNWRKSKLAGGPPVRAPGGPLKITAPWWADRQSFLGCCAGRRGATRSTDRGGGRPIAWSDHLTESTSAAVRVSVLGDVRHNPAYWHCAGSRCHLRYLRGHGTPGRTGQLARRTARRCTENTATSC